MQFPTSHVPLFVYGSLRPGMALWHLISDHVIDSIPASVAGRLWWHDGGAWPLLTLDDGEGRVHGELLRLRPGDAVNRVIIDEEVLYGYEARWLPIDVGGSESDSAVPSEALVMVWNRSTERGAEITGGDFSQAVR